MMRANPLTKLLWQIVA